MRAIHCRVVPLFVLLLSEACYSAHPVTAPPKSGARIQVDLAPRRWVVLNRKDASDTALNAVALYGRLQDRHGDTLVIAVRTVKPEVGRSIYTSEARVMTRLVAGPGITLLESRFSKTSTAVGVLGTALAVAVVIGAYFFIGLVSSGPGG
jgi:hypothetical protein